MINKSNIMDAPLLED